MDAGNQDWINPTNWAIIRDVTSLLVLPAITLATGILRRSMTHLYKAVDDLKKSLHKNELETARLEEQVQAHHELDDVRFRNIEGRLQMRQHHVQGN